MIQVPILTYHDREVGGDKYCWIRTGRGYNPVSTRIGRHACLCEPVSRIHCQPVIAQRRKVGQRAACIDLPQPGTRVDEIQLPETINEHTRSGMTKNGHREYTHAEKYL